MARGNGVYNKIYTPELYEQVNPVNKEILDDFIMEYKQRKKAKSTVSQYYFDLRIILIYILQKYNNKSILELTKKDFRNISILLSDEKGLSSSRVNRLKSAMNSMLTFCEDDDNYNYDINYAKKVAGLPKEKVRTNSNDFFITYDEIVKVTEKLLEIGDLQTAVMWNIGFDSAGRRNEVFQINKQGLLNGNKTNIVKCKRGKMFPLIYLDNTKELIAKYLTERGEDNIDSLWIKENKKNKEPVTKDALYSRILKCSKILSEIRGEECNIFFHSLRHSRIECLLQGQDPRLKNPDGTNRKFSLEECQVFAHHSDPATTQSYAKDHTDEQIDCMFGI